MEKNRTSPNLTRLEATKTRTLMWSSLMNDENAMSLINKSSSASDKRKQWLLCSPILQPLEDQRCSCAFRTATYLLTSHELAPPIARFNKIPSSEMIVFLFWLRISSINCMFRHANEDSGGYNQCYEFLSKYSISNNAQNLISALLQRDPCDGICCNGAAGSTGIESL